MKHLLSVVLFIMPVAFANAETKTDSMRSKQYEIQGRLYIDGKLVSEPGIIALAGEEASISTFSETLKQELKMKVHAQPDQRLSDEIRLKFNLGFRNKSFSFKSSPQLVAKPGKETTVSAWKDPGKKKYEFKVIAVRR